MKVQRILLIVSAILVFASLAAAACTMVWGPEPLEVAGKSLRELVKSDALLVAVGVVAALGITWLLVRPFARFLFPPQIRDGVTTEARVLKVWDTGTTVNDDPQVGLLLEFTPAGGTLLQVEAKTLVSRLQAALVQPGISAEVKYDPQKPQRLQVLTLYLQEATPKSAAARMEELNELRDKGLVSDEEYRQKREEILKAL